MSTTEDRLKQDIVERVADINRLINRPAWTDSQMFALATQLKQASDAAQKLLGIIDYKAHI